MFLPTRRSASSRGNRPKRSNSGNLRPFQTKQEAQTSAAGSGMMRRRPEKQRQVLAAADRRNAERAQRGFGRLETGLLEQFARAPRRRRLSPGSAIPFGMSQRGERGRMPEQQPLAVGDEDAAAGAFGASCQGRAQAAGDAAVKAARRSRRCRSPVLAAGSSGSRAQHNSERPTGPISLLIACRASAITHS